MRVLVVEDDTTSRRILRTYLTNAGHDVVEAADGRAAWELLQNQVIRLVITDWMMPELEGPELIRQIRRAEFAHYTYVMLLTAHDSKDKIVSGLESGADDYLSKPFDPSELRARVEIGVRILDLESRLNEARQQMEFLAMHDGLTNLLNRRAIQERAIAELRQAEMDGTCLSLLMVDIDHFKAVNDRYGHLVGDQALRVAARALQRCTSPQDAVGRWGGEEFLLVLGQTDLPRAIEVAESIRTRVSATSLSLSDGGELSVKVSIGVISNKQSDSHTPDGLLKRADAALYQAKREGRDRVCAYTPA
jgi:two-component system cell cycle response regulator